MPTFIYILQCADGSYYVGKTQASLEHRVAQHNAGTFGTYTASRRPVELAWHQEFQSYSDANAMERRLKGWSRAKKQALIRGDFGAIRILASRRGRKTRN